MAIRKIKELGVIEGEIIILSSKADGSDQVIEYTAKAAIDTDGIGPLHGDRFAQKDTSLHFEGKALNADVDLYIVVPPLVRDSVKGAVLGCLAEVRHIETEARTMAVVGDIGPKRKIGEISRAAAIALGINPNPVSGGESRHVLHYYIYPGKAAVVNGKRYNLQPK